MITKVASVFPFEAEVYEEAGASVEFVGHPLLDIVKPSLEPEEFYQKYDLTPERPLIGLLPGSRKQEVQSLLPVLLASAKKIAAGKPEAQFVLPLAHTVAREKIENAIREENLAVKVIEGHTYELMKVSDIIVVSSGTATLEAACLGTPMVIIYKTSLSTWFLGNLLLKISHIGLPNIIAGREIVPELLQQQANPEKISSQVLELLAKPEKIRKMKEELTRVREKLGGPGAVKRVAQLVLDLGRVK